MPPHAEANIEANIEANAETNADAEADADADVAAAMSAIAGRKFLLQSVFTRIVKQPPPCDIDAGSFDCRIDERHLKQIFEK